MLQCMNWLYCHPHLNQNCEDRIMVVVRMMMMHSLLMLVFAVVVVVVVVYSVHVSCLNLLLVDNSLASLYSSSVPPSLPLLCTTYLSPFNAARVHLAISVLSRSQLKSSRFTWLLLKARWSQVKPAGVTFTRAGCPQGLSKGGIKTRLAFSGDKITLHECVKT
jgi:hypothetical protein